MARVAGREIEIIGSHGFNEVEGGAQAVDLGTGNAGVRRGINREDFIGGFVTRPVGEYLAGISDCARGQDIFGHDLPDLQCLGSGARGQRG